MTTGDEVDEASTVGVVRNLHGEVIEEVLAPEDGVILFITTSPAVAAQGLLLGLGCELTPIVI